MEGRNIANRSRQMYNRQAGPLVGLAVCENNLSLASASLNGSVFVLRYASFHHITLEWIGHYSESCTIIHICIVFTQVLFMFSGPCVSPI
jgi:hypothetical protein